MTNDLVTCPNLDDCVFLTNQAGELLDDCVMLEWTIYSF
jgi:hypothetical protein